MGWMHVAKTNEKGTLQFNLAKAFADTISMPIYQRFGFVFELELHGKI